MTNLVSFADRTHVELGANRRRFRREGVAVMCGDPQQRVPLRVDSVRDIYVRPAYRGEHRQPSWIELLLEKLFVVKP